MDRLKFQIRFTLETHTIYNRKCKLNCNEWLKPHKFLSLIDFRFSNIEKRQNEEEKSTTK